MIKYLLILLLFPVLCMAQRTSDQLPSGPNSTTISGTTYNWTDTTGVTGRQTWLFFGGGKSDRMVRWNDMRVYVANNAPSPTISDTARLGTIFKKTAFSNLADFTATGTFSTNGYGKIYSPAGNTGQLKLNYYTALDEYKLEFDYRCTNGVKNASAGLAIGFISANNTADIGNYSYLNEQDNKIAIHGTFSNTTQYSPSALGSYTAGDSLHYTIDYKSGNYKITVLNKKTTASYTYSFFVVFGVAGGGGITLDFIHNTSQPAIIALGSGAAYEITNFHYSSNMKLGGMLAVGNSITYGDANGIDATHRWATLIGAQVDAGVGDKSREVLLRMPEIISIKAKTTYVTIGTNDFNVPVWASEVQSIYTQLRQSNIGRVFINAPTPNNTHDMGVFRDTIALHYPYINLFNPLKATSGSGIATIYDSGDGTHPNAAGHLKVAQVIMASPTYRVESYYKSLDSTFIATSSIPQTPIGGSPNNVLYKDGSGNVVGDNNFEYVPGSNFLALNGADNGTRSMQISMQNATNGKAWQLNHLTGDVFDISYYDGGSGFNHMATFNSVGRQFVTSGTTNGSRFMSHAWTDEATGNSWSIDYKNDGTFQTLFNGTPFTLLNQLGDLTIGRDFLASRNIVATGNITSTTGNVVAGLNVQGQSMSISGPPTTVTGQQYLTVRDSLTGAIKQIKTSSITGAGGTVSNVSSANTDISVATATTTAVLTLNSGTAANQIVKRDGSGNINATTVTTNANLTGDVTSVGNATAYNNVVPSTKGGAGSVTGLLKATGSGVVTAAVSGTDYLTPSATASTYVPYTGATGIVNLNTQLLQAGQIGVGTGTTTPIGKLQTVETSSSSPRGVTFSQYSTDASGSRVNIDKARGALASPTTIISGDNIGGINPRAYDGTNFLDVARFLVTSKGTISTGIIPSTATISTTNSTGTLKPAIFIDTNQNIINYGLSPMVSLQTTADSHNSSFQREITQNTYSQSNYITVPGGNGNGITQTGSSYLTSPDTGLPNGTNPTFTISMWLKFNAIASRMLIGYGTTASQYILLDLGGASQVRLISNGSVIGSASVPAFVTGQYYNIVVSVSGTTGTLYVNKVAYSLGTLSAYTVTLLSGFATNGVGSETGVSGTYSQIGVWNRQLTTSSGSGGADEIAQIYNLGAGTQSLPTSSLIRLYNFTTGSGTTAFDTNPNTTQYNFTLTGGASWAGSGNGWVPIPGSSMDVRYLQFYNGGAGNETGRLAIGDLSSGLTGLRFNGQTIKHIINNTIPFVQNFAGHVLLDPNNISEAPTIDAILKLGAGTAAAGTAPLKITAGVLPTVGETGIFGHYDGTNFYAYPSTTVKRIALTNNVTPSNGQIPIGNGTDFTTASLAAGTGITITNGPGTISITNSVYAGIFPQTSKTATYTILTTDYYIDCNGTFTVTLPTAVGFQGKTYVINNNGAGTITVGTTSSQTISGNTTITVAAGASATIHSDNANYFRN
jgi:hypothetical protein